MYVSVPNSPFHSYYLLYLSFILSFFIILYLQIRVGTLSSMEVEPYAEHVFGCNRNCGITAPRREARKAWHVVAAQTAVILGLYLNAVYYISEVQTK